MKPKTLITIILILIIILAAIFLYLFFTRNPVLWDLPIFSDKRVPAFLFTFGDTPGPGKLEKPMAAITDGLGNIHIADFERGDIVVYNPEGKFQYSYGKNVQEELQIDTPYGLTSYSGRIYVADLAKRRIVTYSERGEYQGLFFEADTTSETGAVIPTAMTVNPSNGNLYVADVFAQRVLVLDQQGKVVQEIQPESGQMSLSYPNGLVLDNKGNIYVCDSNNARIVVFSPDGKTIEMEVLGVDKEEKKISVPRGISFDPRGNYWVADMLTHNIIMFNKDRLVLQFGGMGLEEGELYFPNDVLYHVNGNLYVVESGSGRVSVFGLRTTSED